jgi:hypothetical protein
MRELATRLRYIPATGELIWMHHPHPSQRRLIGTRAGNLNVPGGGYRHVSGVSEHRLIWFMLHGTLPSPGMCIDHINGIRDDNRQCNLRCVSRSDNNRLAKVRSDNASGYKGVSWFMRIGKWRADIALPSGKRKYLGSFDCPQKASLAYQKALLTAVSRAKEWAKTQSE